MDDTKTIREMLDAVRAERKRIADRDDVLEERESTLLDWLKEESPAQAELLPKANGHRSATPLGKFIEIALSNGARHTMQELIALVRQNSSLTAKHGAAPGRAVNMVLQGWKRNGYVHKDAQERWSFKQGH